MANGKQERNTKLTWEDFETYLPQYEFDEKQIEFLREITTIPYIDPEMLSEKFVMYLEKRYSEVA